MAITHTNTVKINGADFTEVVTDRTSSITIRTPLSPEGQPKGSRYTVIVSRQRIITRGGEQVQEALSPNVPDFISNLTLSASDLMENDDLAALQMQIAEKIDSIISEKSAG